jgi:hypothetical protein
MILKRMVIVTMRGAFTTTDALDRIARQRSEQTWEYGVLVDLRFLNSEPTIDELQRILSDDVGGEADAGRRGPLAFVVTDPIL